MEHPSYRAMQEWLKSNAKAPNGFERVAGNFQKYIQNKIPNAIHKAITAGMSGFTKAIMAGSGWVLPKLPADMPLDIREKQAQACIQKYVQMGMASGAGTSAGSLATGLMDLPILMGLKMRMLFEIGAIFGYDLNEPSERLYSVMIFRTVFSSPLNRLEKVQGLIRFEKQAKTLEEPLEHIDWQAFQQEYRDYLDLAKLLQFVPGVGIVVGVVVNRQLLMTLGEGAINAYRLRYFQNHPEERQLG